MARYGAGSRRATPYTDARGILNEDYRDLDHSRVEDAMANLLGPDVARFLCDPAGHDGKLSKELRPVSLQGFVSAALYDAVAAITADDWTTLDGILNRVLDALVTECAADEDAARAAIREAFGDLLARRRDWLYYRAVHERHAAGESTDDIDAERFGPAFRVRAAHLSEHPDPWANFCTICSGATLADLAANRDYLIPRMYRDAARAH